MSATIIGSALAALTTVTTVVVATLPEAQMLLSPLTEGGHEYAAVSAGLIVSLPILAVLTLLAGSAKD
ncbi:MAG: hypothetical protein CTY31_01810 [Hyphomicrobium sp.]|nr:MAG: hypothetical protein CTY39_09020 [Hyphomicrobium sp.]PPD01948.1 MAG: hypothetical protein CTY31_01810 [Hyphomicrobium sp.]